MYELTQTCLDLYNSVNEAVCSGLLCQRGQSELFSILKSWIYNQTAVMWRVDWGGDQCLLLLWFQGVWQLCHSCLRDWERESDDFGGILSVMLVIVVLLEMVNMQKRQEQQSSRQKTLSFTLSYIYLEEHPRLCPSKAEICDLTQRHWCQTESEFVPQQMIQYIKMTTGHWAEV